MAATQDATERLLCFDGDTAGNAEFEHARFELSVNNDALSYGDYDETPDTFVKPVLRHGLAGRMRHTAAALRTRRAIFSVARL